MAEVKARAELEEADRVQRIKLEREALIAEQAR